jgi:D-tyrosyl-tRNA(Tyr) deacylase
VKAVVQRVTRAEVRVDGVPVGRIGRGLVVLVAVERGDGDADVGAISHKLTALRVFPGRTPMDRTLAEVGGGCLVVSQFTLAANLGKGNRPSFEPAEEPAPAEQLYLRLCARLRAEGLPVETGRFGADMELELVNDGPATFLLVTKGGALLKAAG